MSPIRIFIDGDCGLCRREAAVMQRLDRGRGLIEVVDIAAPGFDPSPFGATQDQLMGAIHADVPGKGLISGLEVFRRVYAALGWYGWLWAPTGWPVLRPVCNVFYRWFARHRIRISSYFGGRHGCADGSCRVG